MGRVTTLKKGTISEIRSKIFDSQKGLDRRNSDHQITSPPMKAAPRKFIIPTAKNQEVKEKDVNTPSSEKESISPLINSNVINKSNDNEIHDKESKGNKSKTTSVE